MDPCRTRPSLRQRGARRPVSLTRLTRLCNPVYGVALALALPVEEAAAALLSTSTILSPSSFTFSLFADLPRRIRPTTDCKCERPIPTGNRCHLTTRIPTPDTEWASTYRTHRSTTSA